MAWVGLLSAVTSIIEAAPWCAGAVSAPGKSDVLPMTEGVAVAVVVVCEEADALAKKEDIPKACGSTNLVTPMATRVHG